MIKKPKDKEDFYSIYQDWAIVEYSGPPLEVIKKLY